MYTIMWLNWSQKSDYAYLFLRMLYYRMQNAEKLVTALRKELNDAQHRQGHGSRSPGRESRDPDSNDWRLSQLQVQYDHLQSRAATQDKMMKESESKVEVRSEVK